jgi:hypothetical protein
MAEKIEILDNKVSLIIDDIKYICYIDENLEKIENSGSDLDDFPIFLKNCLTKKVDKNYGGTYDYSISNENTNKIILNLWYISENMNMQLNLAFYNECLYCRKCGVCIP